MVDVDGLEIKIKAELEKYRDLCLDDLQSAAAEAGKEGLKEVKRLSPKKAGKYRSGWKMKKTDTRTGVEVVLYQDKKPFLTHLLENGHFIVKGNKLTSERSKAFPHIKPAQDLANATFEKLVEEKLK